MRTYLACTRDHRDVRSWWSLLWNNSRWFCWYSKLLLIIELPLPRHVPVAVPGHQCVPLLAPVHGIEIWVRHVSSHHPVIRQQRDVAVTHDGLPERFDTVALFNQ